LLFRIVWGFVGPETARFTSFVRGPAAIVSYTRSLLRPPHEFHAGHNPLGGIVVVLMLALLLFQAMTGLFANDDIATDGPFARLISKSASDAITALHYRNSWLIIGLIVLHVVAVFVYLIRYRDNLIRPMLSGVKQVPAGALARGITGSRSVLALVVIGFSALVAWFAFELPRWIVPLPF
jgi:cytochrome b